MISTIYIEHAVENHPRTVKILKRFPHATIIKCEKYTEIFNRKSQNFRIQKTNPALILARKLKNFILPAPAEYNIGAENNYYFSHMLNCIYDCRYCFLQGMYSSAHYVLFVNYEDFSDAILDQARIYEGKPVHMFSGYDCDSLALEPLTNFIEYFLPVFRDNPNLLLEIRTKSTQIRALLDKEPFSNCIVAFSFTPATIARALEHLTPGVTKRINAMVQLQKKGWSIGIRFDPLIYDENFKQNYKVLFDSIFNKLNVDKIHSVSLGSFRLPKKFFKKISELYPDELLLASPFEDYKGMISYRDSIRREMIDYCVDALSAYIPKERFFPCEDPGINPL